MKQGALIFDKQTDRYDIRFDLADYYGGLHCGECFDVMIGGKWRPTRIEIPTFGAAAPQAPALIAAALSHG